MGWSEFMHVGLLRLHFGIFDVTTNIFKLTDGITWTDRTYGTTYWLGGVTYGNGTFVAVGGYGMILKSGQIFTDIPSGYWAYDYIDTIYTEGITVGCGNGNYCPEDPVTRAQMAVFIVKSIGETPAATCTGTMFNDVSEATVGDAFCRYIEKFSTLGITAGCSANPPLYCPFEVVTRAQMAVFLTKGFLQ